MDPPTVAVMAEGDERSSSESWQGDRPDRASPQPAPAQRVKEGAQEKNNTTSQESRVQGAEEVEEVEEIEEIEGTSRAKDKEDMQGMVEVEEGEEGWGTWERGWGLSSVMRSVSAVVTSVASAGEQALMGPPLSGAKEENAPMDDQNERSPNVEEGGWRGWGWFQSAKDKVSTLAHQVEEGWTKQSNGSIHEEEQKEQNEREGQEEEEDQEEEEEEEDDTSDGRFRRLMAHVNPTPNNDLGMLLGKMIQEVTDADIEQVRSKAAGLATSSLQASRKILKKVGGTGMEAGREIATHGIHTLENVGRLALRFISSEESDDAAEWEEATSGEDPPEPPHEGSDEWMWAGKDVTFAAAFEHYGGVTGLHLMEALSTECMMRLQFSLPKYSSKERGWIDASFRLLHTIFNLEEDLPSGITGIPSSDARKSVDTSPQAALLYHMVEEGQEQATHLLEAFKQSSRLSDLHGKGDAELRSLLVLDVTGETLDNVKRDSVLRLAQFGSCAISQLHELAKKWADEEASSEDQDGRDIALVRALFIRELAQRITNNISILSSAYITGLREVAKYGRSVAMESVGDTDSMSHWDSLDPRVQASSTGVYLESGNAVSHVHDAIQHFLPVCKSFVTCGRRSGSPTG